MPRSVVMRWMLLTWLPWLAAMASCSSAERDVRGTVTVNGKPIEQGTISFQPGGNATGKGVGAAINSGRFELPAKLPTGNYNVTVEGFQKTGRTFADPQRGKVEESAQLRLQRMPVQIEVSAENSDDVQVDLKTAK